MRVAGGSSYHPLPLPIHLRCPLKTLKSSGGIHQSPKGLIVPQVQFLLKSRSETAKEAIPLLAIRVHLTTSILSQVVKLGNKLHYRPTPLAQLYELDHLLVDNTSRDEERSKGGGELLPCCRMI